MALAVALGLVVATCRLYGPAPVRGLALAYVEFFRGIPLLLLLLKLVAVRAGLDHQPAMVPLKEPGDHLPVSQRKRVDVELELVGGFRVQPYHHLVTGGAVPLLAALFRPFLHLPRPFRRQLNLPGPRELERSVAERPHQIRGEG